MFRFLRTLFGLAPRDGAISSGSPRLARPALQQLESRHLPYAGVLGTAAEAVGSLNTDSQGTQARAEIRKSELKAALSGVVGAGGPPVIGLRDTDVSFPARVRVGKAYNLRVQIGVDRVRLHPHDARLDLQLPTTAGASSSVRVKVIVTAENFEIDGPSRAEMDVDPAGKSSPVQFSLRGEEVGPGRVIVDFLQDGRSVGWVDLSPEVVRDQEWAEPVTAEWGANSTHAGPDVTLKVFEHRHTGAPGRLHFVLSSARPDLQDLPVLDGDLGVRDLHAAVAPWVEDQLRTLCAVATQPEATAAEVNRVLSDIGHRLYEELLPRSLQDLCWTLRRRGVRSMLILSDEPHIPWELVKPFRADPTTGALVKEDGFWGETFALTHWLRGRPPVRRFDLDRVVVLAAQTDTATRDMKRVGSKAASQSGEAALVAIEEELDLLRRLCPDAELVRLPARRGKLREALEQADFGLLHVACHGTFGGVAAADQSAVLMEDGPFSAAELSPRMAGPLRQSAPLIFFNACHSGRLGFSLTGLGSWGARLVQLGCGGFVGTLWPVTDCAARVFAGVFYERLTRGEAIGEAVAQARRAVRERYPGDPTWLAYRCFADPQARAGQVDEQER